MESCSNLKSAATALIVPLPSILFYLFFLRRHREDPLSPSLWTWCFHHPFLLANALFFFNVNCIFWIIAALQSSHWMIDLYWTVISMMLVHYYATHPSGAIHQNVWRSRVVILMTWIWGIRLTHSYFRREKWRCGGREDWRFSDMRRRYGKQWWWVSFFAVYVSQQVLLMGICLPFHAIHALDDKPLNIRDFTAILMCSSGIIFAYYADTQLHHFVTANPKVKGEGRLLKTGLWGYSRHPNYFGEQMWWWGVGVLGWNMGQKWGFVGALMNSVCLGFVTKLVEERIVKDESRAEAYRMYQKTTSVWVPWKKKVYNTS